MHESGGNFGKQVLFPGGPPPPSKEERCDVARLLSAPASTLLFLADSGFEIRSDLGCLPGAGGVKGG